MKKWKIGIIGTLITLSGIGANEYNQGIEHEIIMENGFLLVFETKEICNNKKIEFKKIVNNYLEEGTKLKIKDALTLRALKDYGCGLIIEESLPDEIDNFIITPEFVYADKQKKDERKLELKEKEAKGDILTFLETREMINIAHVEKINLSRKEFNSKKLNKYILE